MPLVSGIYSFISSFFVSALAPVTDKGFFGILVGHFFGSIWQVLCWGVYWIGKWFLAFMDFLQYFIQKLIGLDYWLQSERNGRRSLDGATSEDMVFKFLYSETVQKVFRTLCALFVIFLIISLLYFLYPSRRDICSAAATTAGWSRSMTSSLFFDNVNAEQPTDAMTLSAWS